MQKGISVIICCYNSAKRLPQTLLHIAKQQLTDTIECELIVVDNNCNDDTVDVTNAIWKELASNIPLTIVEEKTPGLSSARQKGVAAAKYEYIIFCDDDNWLNPFYVVKGFNLMENNAAIGAACGYNEAISDIEFPYWFNTYASYYATGVLSLHSADVTSRGWIWGAGMILRKSILVNLQQAGFKNLTSDRKGKELSTGGDVEICKWMILIGYKLWYDESLSLQHFIPKERLQKAYLEKLIVENEKILSLFHTYDFIIRVQTVKESSTFWLLFLIKLPFKLLFKRHTFQEKLYFSYLKSKIGKSENSIYSQIQQSLQQFRNVSSS
jgi:glycosyltransferase involved in cell wall biosynthesis